MEADDMCHVCLTTRTDGQTMPRVNSDAYSKSGSLILSRSNMVNNKNRLCVFVCVLLTLFNGCYSFNLDTANLLEYKGPNSGSFFGYSVAMLKTQTEKWILVGAPMDHSTYLPDVSRSGAIYKVTFTDKNSFSMREILVDTAIMDRIKRRKLSEEETVKNHSEDQEKRLLIFDMNEKEVEMLATHLGHDVRTHKENYRLAHSTRELTAVAQLLLTVERGDVNRWKGKKLCDIEIEDLEVLEDEKKDLDQNHKRGYAEDTHTALWDPPNEATQGLDLGGDSGSDGGDVQATVAQLCGQSTSVITEGASHLPGASTTQRVSTDKKGLPRKSKNRPWSRAASDFLRNTFKPYLTGKDSSVHNSDMKNAQKICGELNTRSLPQIRAKLNNMKLGKSQ